MMGLQREGYCSQLSSSGNINQASLRVLPMDHSLPPLAAQACGPYQSTLLISPYPQRPGGSGWWLGYCLSAYMSVAACWFHMCCQHQPTFPPAPTPAVSPFRATTESLFSGHTAWGAGSQVPDRWWNPCPLQWKHRVQSAGNSLTVFLIICFGFVASVMSLFQTISDCCLFFCLWDLTSPARDGTHAPCIGNMESQPLVLQRSPLIVVFWIFYFFLS